MAFRLKWLLIMAFAIGHFGMVGVTAAFAMPDNPVVGEMAMDNCDDGAHCCVSAAFAHCSTCVTCAGYAVPETFSERAKLDQVHEMTVPEALLSIIRTVDPPPPRK